MKSTALLFCMGIMYIISIYAFNTSFIWHLHNMVTGGIGLFFILYLLTEEHKSKETKSLGG